MLHFALTKVDIESAFLQTGAAMKDVYVVPLRKCANRVFYWFLPAATYGLVNANAKSQHHSDEVLRILGFLQLVYIPQLFYKKVRDGVYLLAVKVVDDIILVGRKPHLLEFVKQISDKYDLGTVVHTPGTLNFFGLTITQDEDGTIRLSADEKLEMLQPYCLDRVRRKDIDDHLNAVELFSFGSLNGSLGWIGNTVGPFCSFATSYLQQRRANPTVKDLICQNNMLKVLKRLGTTITYKKPERRVDYDVSVVVFSDAGRFSESDSGQLGFIAGLLIGNLKSGAVFHTVSWGCRRSKRPLKSIGAAETLAAGSAIDDGKVTVKAYEALLGIKIKLIVVVDSKDLFDSLSTCINPIDKSTRADVNIIRYEFETEKVNRLVWVPGKLNLADPLTKPDSPLLEALQLMLFAGEMPFDLHCGIHRDSEKFLG